MHDFSCTNPDDMNYEVLAKKAQYFKQDKKAATMYTIMEYIADYTELSLDTIKEVASQSVQLETA